MTNVELVIFDMDGLMFDTESVGKVCYKQAVNHFGYSIDDEFYDSLLGGNMKRNQQLIREYMGEGFPMAEVSKMSKELRYAALETNGIGIKKGLVELLDYLDANHIKKAIASSSNVDTIEYYLKLAHLEGRFDVIMSGQFVERSKPYPDIFLSACKKVNVKPSHALVLEDSRNGVMAAYNGNIPCICVPDLLFHDQELLGKCVAFVPDLSKVIDFIEGKKYKLAIFDMDGLMFDTERLCIEPLIEAHKLHGYEMTREHTDLIIGTAGEVANQLLKGVFGEGYDMSIVASDIERLLLQKVHEEGLPFKEGIEELLVYLNDLGIDCVIGSSSDRWLIEDYMKLSGLKKYFKHIVSGDVVAYTKPEPDIFKKCCEDLGVNIQDAIVFEDSKNGIIASSRAGIDCVCVPDLLFHSQNELDLCEAFMYDLNRVKLLIK